MDNYTLSKGFSGTLENVKFNKKLFEEDLLPHCAKCGKCCTDVLMATDQEIKKVKEYVKKYNIKPVNRNTIFDKEQKNICPFLNKDNICLIYPVRLKMCQRFFCGNRKEDNGLETYKNVKVISMMQTFFLF